ncbi:hypothetical protein JW890_04190, partial [candidate division WOR-3 bacterium]|nr:hypothetical protein [candidate division WOR-3 bacterium]
MLLLISLLICISAYPADGRTENSNPFTRGDSSYEIDGTAVFHPSHDPGPLKPLLPEYYPLMLRDPIVPTDPPVAPVRMCAEWEPAVSVLIRYP